MTVLFIYIDLSLSFFDALVINQRGTKVFYCNFDCNLHAQQQYACFYKKKKKMRHRLPISCPNFDFIGESLTFCILRLFFRRGCHNEDVMWQVMDAVVLLLENIKL